MSWIYPLKQVYEDVKSRFAGLTQNLHLEGRVIVKTYKSFVTLNLKFNVDSVRGMTSRIILTKKKRKKKAMFDC